MPGSRLVSAGRTRSRSETRAASQPGPQSRLPSQAALESASESESESGSAGESEARPQPRSRHVPAGRTRSRSETRAASQPGPQSKLPSQALESASESESESGSAGESEARQQSRSSKMHLKCPGCNKVFADRTNLRQHCNAWRTADPACRNAAHKRPRNVRLDVDSAQDANDRIRRMMGDRSNSGLAAAQSPFPQPIDEVGPGDRDGLTRRHRFTQCLHIV